MTSLDYVALSSLSQVRRGAKLTYCETWFTVLKFKSQAHKIHGHRDKSETWWFDSKVASNIDYQIIDYVENDAPNTKKLIEMPQVA